MLPASDRPFGRRDVALFAACLALSLTALFAPERLAGDVATALRQTVLAPLVWLQERAVEGRTSRARLRALTAARDSAAYAAQSVPALAAENERLRQLLGLSRRLRTPYVPAEVLHQPQATDARMLLLNVGRADGVAGFDPVVAPEGLIGLIWSAGPRSSVAMTWAHPEFRVSAFTASGGAFGIVASSPSPSGSDAYLEFRGVPYRDTIPPGTLVLSSGLGGVYPKGIPIGTVVGVVREEAGWERVYRLRPAANPAATAHVLVLTAPGQGRVADAYAVDSVAGPPEGGAATALRSDSAAAPPGGAGRLGPRPHPAPHSAPVPPGAPVPPAGPKPLRGDSTP